MSSQMIAMYLSKGRIPFLLMFLWAFFAQLPLGRSQEGQDLVMSLSQGDTLANNEELKDIVLRLHNPTGKDLEGKLRLRCSEGGRIVTKDLQPVSVPYGATVYLPFKIYITSSAMAGPVVYKADVVPNDGPGELASLEGTVFVTANRSMRIEVLEKELIMPHPGQLLRVPVRVANRGNVASQVRVVLAFPAALQDASNKFIKLDMPPMYDTVVYLERKVSRSMAKLEYMDLSIYGTYQNGDYFGMATTSVQRIKSSKKFGQEERVPLGRDENKVSLSVQNAFSNSESYTLQAQGKYAIGDGALGFNVNAYKWKNSGAPLMVNDTWLEWEQKEFRLKAGNITQHGELSYMGRGLDADYYWSDKQQKLSVGYIDKSFNLLDPLGSGSFGQAAWLGHSWQKEHWTHKSMLSFDEDKYTMNRSIVLAEQMAWKWNSGWTMGGKVGLANTYATFDGGGSKPSLSLGGYVNGSIGKRLSLSSDNLYASGYYPGSRRGSLSLNERLNYRVGRSIAVASLMYNESSPLYIRPSGFPVINQESRSTASELGMNRSWGALQASVAAQYYHENGYWYANGSSLPGHMDALRGVFSLSYTHRTSGQNVLFRWEGGNYTTGFSNVGAWQMRSNLSYNYRMFRLNAFLQNGNFYLTDVFQELMGAQTKLRLNIAPSVTGSLFERRLKYNAGVTYYKDFYVESWVYTAGLDLDLGPAHLFGNFQYNAFSNSAQYQNIQLGCVASLPKSRPVGEARKQGRLELFLFFDENGNGVFDEGDSVAAGYMAAIGKILFMADKQGRVVYSQLPEGTLSLRFPLQGSWYAPQREIFVGSQEQAKVAIPLVRTGIVHGRISFVFDPLLSYKVETNLAGRTIRATNQQGLSFETKTDDYGLYMLPLPDGVYHITVDGLSDQIVVQPSVQMPLTVGSGQILEGVDFVLQVRQRKIEVKRFGGQ